ncbi:M28 family peptidase [Luteibacter aegosomaticola]|uniref:transferrin receptor-like dimerization domain-containing protein n=1 Tax=Luteibacter aegosomaticola TaxID=2911538 RepID=UPI001FF8D109|nr:transferrin receptor-like dimerization domain-containing protein [Luteibacter aegosomaticola]UPG91706.1 M28 family peptidase [Luteibacter aegosomaticola]
MRAVISSLVLTAAVAATTAAAQDAALAGFGPTAASAERGLEQRADASIDKADLDGWLKQLTSAPNNVGAAHNKENADFIAASLRSWGWDVKVEPVKVLVAYPTTQKLSLSGGDPYAADFTEPAVAGDPDTAKQAGVLPGMESYSPDGRVDAPLVFVNEGLARDYDDLERLGASVKGKVVLVKSSGAGRWVKPRLAQQHGAVGVVIYSDPEADGFPKGDVYPTGAWRTERTLQRGTLGIDSVLDAKGAKTLQAEHHTADLSIPVVTIGYGDAEHFLRALGGKPVPLRWQGGLPLTYHVGGDAGVHLEVASPWEWRTLYNVVATLRGSTWPDEWVIRGVHHDAWVFGAWDPLAGTTALLAEAKALGELARAGQRPKRTLVFASWDGEELGILGSKAWAERHAGELATHAVFYLNNDTTGRGFLSAGGDPSLAALVDGVAADLKDPETGATVQARRLAKRAVDAAEKGRNAEGEIVPQRLGTGSDYLPFAHRFGVPSLHVRYGYDRDGDEESVPVYHSLYDTYTHYQRFGDPGLAYVGLLAKTNARLVLRTANADVLPWRYTSFATSLGKDIDRLQASADAAHRESQRHNALVDNGAYGLASVAYRQLQPPARVDEALQAPDLAPLRDAQQELLAAARAYDEAAGAASELPAAKAAKVNATLRAFATAWLQPAGLPQRPWYRHLLQAPGRKEGEDVAPLPAIGDALDAKDTAQVKQEITLTTEATRKAAALLKTATTQL